MLHTQVNLTPANILYTDFLFNYQRATELGLGVLTPPSTTLDQRGRTWFLGLKDQIYVARGTLLELGFAEIVYPGSPDSVWHGLLRHHPYRQRGQ